jgi:ribosome-associated heat shock protein Hsp15
VSEPTSQRIDKWLWHARFAKTRTAAQILARSGRIRVNRTANDSVSRLVKIGDLLTIRSERGVRVVRIVAIGTRRGPASEAEALYDQVLTVSAGPDPRGSVGTPRTVRPDKRARRRLAELKRSGGQAPDSQSRRP